jgi:RimJ/RimL family protein N-acetyltransferase
MADQPVLETRRLILRPFTQRDAPWVYRYAGDREIARTTQNIPHPYTPEMAEKWIAAHPDTWARGIGVVCAIDVRDGAPIGAVGLRIERDDERAELGYWVGREWWGHGYATEAAAELVRWGFQSLGLRRVMARHMGSNPASGRVMQKIGMIREGVLRKHYVKWGRPEDIVVYGILAGEKVS